MTGTEQLAPDVATSEQAVLAADIAARASGVVIRELADIVEVDAVGRLYDQIWQPEIAPISTELLRAFAKSGNYVAGAFDGDILVGACVGFFAAPATATLHSHIAGVLPTVPRRNIGYALKLHQRAWSLLRGVTAIEWTFDPLVARNAYFNCVKLGARPREYLPNFYGGMRDLINGDDDTDRLLMRWDLRAPHVLAASSGERVIADVAAERAAGAGDALAVAPDGDEPVIGSLDGAVSLVFVPPDIEAMRVADAALAKRWRLAVRTVLGGLLASGAEVTGFDRRGCYIVRSDRSGVTR